MYRILYQLLLSRLPAEATHRAAFFALRILMGIPGVGRLSRRLLCPTDPALIVEALGLRFPSPLGLAAGFDKDAKGFGALSNLGFGFVEIGTVTGQAQPGNPKPRMFRLPQDNALINRMGFNNRGAAAAARRLARRPKHSALIVGANIGKTKRVHADEAIADYVQSAKLLAPVCDYMVVNVSSPNTPGLRDMQAIDRLRPLLIAVRETLSAELPCWRLPLLVKISPDLANDDIDAVVTLAIELGLDGIIATNTTISRDRLQSDDQRVASLGDGGLSGAPLKQRSLEVLRRISAIAGDKLVIISAGGIESADDVFDRLQAGAKLVQAYTGFIYGGPGWPRQVNRRLAFLLES